jgi:hypothetical protein
VGSIQSTSLPSLLVCNATRRKVGQWADRARIRAIQRWPSAGRSVARRTRVAVPTPRSTKHRRRNHGEDPAGGIPLRPPSGLFRRRQPSWRSSGANPWGPSGVSPAPHRSRRRRGPWPHGPAGSSRRRPTRLDVTPGRCPLRGCLAAHRHGDDEGREEAEQPRYVEANERPPLDAAILAGMTARPSQITANPNRTIILLRPFALARHRLCLPGTQPFQCA